MIAPQNRPLPWQNHARTGSTAHSLRESSQLYFDCQLSRGGGKGRHQHPGRTGQRHWFRITGLPGWKRAQLMMPAFGDENCFVRRRTSTTRKIVEFLRHCFGQRSGKSQSASDMPFSKSP